jgi:hypothetical protein
VYNVYDVLRQIASDDVTFISMVSAGDEGWIYSYDSDKATIHPTE